MSLDTASTCRAPELDAAARPQIDAATSPKTAAHRQVDKQHYALDKYVDRARWLSYWEQIEAATSIAPASALCIGVGDDIVPSVLERAGIAVQRFDFEPSLHCDHVGDVRDIARIVAPASVDVVLCCQVLEHIPFEDFEPTLRAICAVAKRRVVISLPYHHKRLASLALKLPKLPRLEFDWCVPRFWHPWRFDGQHHWEVGAAGHPRRRIERVVAAVGLPYRSFFARGNHYHLFFILDR
jgi:methyltransferase family protein